MSTLHEKNVFFFMCWNNFSFSLTKRPNCSKTSYLAGQFEVMKSAPSPYREWHLKLNTFLWQIGLYNAKSKESFNCNLKVNESNFVQNWTKHRMNHEWVNPPPSIHLKLDVLCYGKL